MHYIRPPPTIRHERVLDLLQNIHPCILVYSLTIAVFIVFVSNGSDWLCPLTFSLCSEQQLWPCHRYLWIFRDLVSIYWASLCTNVIISSIEYFSWWKGNYLKFLNITHKHRVFRFMMIKYLLTSLPYKSSSIYTFCICFLFLTK